MSLDVDCSLVEAIDLLEDCYYADITIEGAPLSAVAAAAAREHQVAVGSSRFAQECHQIVFSKELELEDSADILQRVVYRADLPYQPEYSAISYPAELNRRPNTTAAVGLT